MSEVAETARLLVRALSVDDLDAIQRLHSKCFPSITAWSREELESHLKIFPEGQIGIELDNELVAISSSLIVHGEDFLGDHTFAQVSDDGMLRTHDKTGDTLYGIDIAVDPERRGFRLARRLYDARKELAIELNLKGIMIAGRIPTYHEHKDRFTAREYLKGIISREFDDPVINAQRSNQFTVRRILANYLPEDTESCGYAVLMEWLNPEYVPDDHELPDRIRVCSVQYQMRSVESVEEFEKQCRFFIDTASDYRCDIMVFPELFTNQLMSLVTAKKPNLTARALNVYTERFTDFFGQMAIKYNVNIVAGTHLTVEDGVLYNISYLFHRNGRVDRQYKIHVTPSEAQWWGVKAGNRVDVFETDCGPIAILICYDVEFPELARIATSKGARVLFVPFNTDIRSGYLRVRSCAQARAIENHVYVVMSGAVGNLPSIDGSDIHYAQSAILTPSDIEFARDGIAAETTANVETMLVHDLDMDLLRRTRRTGTVRTILDRRRDLYSIVYHGENGEEHH
jgi:predicted amidohydrolase/ribosomal protein S18 acetylase RimI-like enzyme